LSAPGIAIDYNISLAGDVYRFSLPEEVKMSQQFYNLSIAQNTSMVARLEYGQEVGIVETPLTGRIYTAIVTMGTFTGTKRKIAVVEVLRFPLGAPDSSVTERASLIKLNSLAMKDVDQGNMRGKFAGIDTNIHTVDNPVGGSNNFKLASIRADNQTIINVLTDEDWYQSLNESLMGGNLLGASHFLILADSFERIILYSIEF
jgi:hypothetical protein